MSRLTALSLRQRSVVVLLALLIAFAGVFSITRLKTELLPDMEFPLLTVITVYPGAGPDAIDEQVAQPLTTAISAVPGIKTTSSTASDGFALVIAEFDFGEDMDARQTDISRAIANVQLPDGAQTPSVERLNLQQLPVLQLTLSAGEDADIAELRTLAQTEFVPELSSADGVNRVEVVGGADDELQILLDSEALAKNGITTDQISGALQANNISLPAGSLTTNGSTLPVRVDSQIDSIETLQNLIVGVSGTTPVTLGDVAKIEIAPAPSSGVARTNGQPSVAINIYMSQGANTVETAANAREKLDDITARLQHNGTDVEITTLLDQSVFIQDSIDSLVREAALGAVFAIVVILAFLLSVRSTLVTAISIPMSMLIAFVLLWWQGISLNIMTLGGLAVAVGRVVDDSIVVLESIFRHVQRGEDTKRATLEGTKEVAMAITASTLTTVAVFLPLAFVGGIIGEIFRPFALTVTFALLASLLVALTIVPVMSSFFIRRDKIRPTSENGNWLTRAYEPALKAALRRPVWTIVIAVVILIGSLALTPFIGTSFIASGGEKGAIVTVDFPSGTSEDEALAQSKPIEDTIQDVVNVETIQTQIGGDALTQAFTGASSNTATITVIFDPDVDLNTSLDALRDAMNAADTDAAITVSDLASQGMGGNTVNVVVQGDNYDEVSKVTQELTEQVAGVQNVANVENDVVAAKPEIEVTIDPQKAAMNGSASAMIAMQVRAALSGVPAGQLVIDGQPLPVTMRYANTDSADALAQLPIAGEVTLGDVATIEQVDAPAQIIRQDGVRTATITGVITSDETGGAIADVQKIMNDYEAPEGITISSGGIAEQQGEAFANMLIAIVIAIAAVYIVMVASFNSLTTPFVILFSLPLAIIGVLLALFISGKTLGLPALIGLLMLVGIVVTNAIVLLEYVIELRQRGLPLRDALVEGGKTRLRPILMTAIATILALTPLALSGEGGALIASDLAVVVIGGLFTSTLLTLFVVPVVYELIGGWQERRANRHAVTPDEPAPANP
ncbi:MAG TPA: efflux RND transporter permease subunit [Thermomicrobiales bacterium]|nr:efflux RND transporter permease subunit [Thermomicrobiales bacterium]